MSKLNKKELDKITTVVEPYTFSAYERETYIHWDCSSERADVSTRRSSLVSKLLDTCSYTPVEIHKTSAGKLSLGEFVCHKKRIGLKRWKKEDKSSLTDLEKKEYRVGCKTAKRNLGQDGETYSPEPDECETLINYDDSSNVATLYTMNMKDYRRCVKNGYVEVERFVNGKSGHVIRGGLFVFPKQLVSYRTMDDMWEYALANELSNIHSLMKGSLDAEAASEDEDDFDDDNAEGVSDDD